MGGRDDDDLHLLRRLLFVGLFLGLVSIEAIGAQQQAKREIRSRLRTDLYARRIEIDDDPVRFLETGGGGAAGAQPVMSDQFRRLAEADNEQPVGGGTLRRDHVERRHGFCGKARNLRRPFDHTARIGLGGAGDGLRLARGLQHNGERVFKRGGIGERNIEFGGHVFLLFFYDLHDAHDHGLFGPGRNPAFFKGLQSLKERHFCGMRNRVMKPTACSTKRHRRWKNHRAKHICEHAGIANCKRCD